MLFTILRLYDFYELFLFTFFSDFTAVIVTLRYHTDFPSSSETPERAFHPKPFIGKSYGSEYR